MPTTSVLPVNLSDTRRYYLERPSNLRTIGTINWHTILCRVSCRGLGSRPPTPCGEGRHERYQGIMVEPPFNVIDIDTSSED